MVMTWSQVKAFAQKLDTALEGAIQEQEADTGTRFYHESDFTDIRTVRVSLEDHKYSLRHGAGNVKRSFSGAGLIPSWADAFLEAYTDYQDPRLDEKIVQDFVELVKAALPLDSWARASVWLVAAWLGMEVTVERVTYLESTAIHRIEGRLGDRPLRIDMERSYPDLASAAQVRDMLARECRALTRPSRSPGRA